MSNLEQRAEVLDELKTHQSVFAVGWDDKDDNQMTVSATIDFNGSTPENLFRVVAENLADAIRGCAPENEETKRSFYRLCVVLIGAELLEKLGIEYDEIEGVTS